MPEFYDQGTCSYQLAAQPYLDAIARGIRDKAESRAFLLEGTDCAQPYAVADPPWREQWKRRDPTNSLQCPFWSNYWYKPCRSCDCRIDNSVSMGDKQELLQAAVPDMIQSLVSPSCVDGSGNVLGPSQNAQCAQGHLQFPPVQDLHVAIVSSSLGGRGSDACPATTTNPANPAHTGRGGATAALSFDRPQAARHA